MSKRYHTRPERDVNKRLIQVLRGLWPDAQIGNVNFFHFWNGAPKRGMINVAWVKDLRPKQLALHGYEEDCLTRAKKWLRIDRKKFASVDAMVCPTERFAEEVFLWYERRVPWFHFANYPDTLKPGGGKRRSEIVYIDNGSTLYPEFYSKVAAFMEEVASRSGHQAVLVSKRFVNDIKSLERGSLRIETPRHYDRMSSHGLLVNVDSFAQADECLPRKMLYYLHAGIMPLVHGSFTSSILYLAEHGIKPLVYYDVDGAVEAIAQQPSSQIAPSIFSVQARIPELRNILEKQRARKKGAVRASRVTTRKAETTLNILSVSIWDYAGCGYFLSQAVSDTTPHTSHAAVFSRSPLTFPVEFMEPADREFEGMWNDADVIHIHDAAPKWKTRIHLPPKPTVITHHGSRYRRAFEVYNNAAQKAKWVLTVSTPDLVARGSQWLPDCRPDLARYVDRADTFTVCHAPTSRAVKNTEHVIKALAPMGEVALDLIEGKSWEECLVRKGRASVLVDQFKLGYGCNSIEAWSMGIPTIGNGPPEALELIEQQLGYLPFVKCGAGIKSIRAAIDRLHTDQAYYDEMARKGHDYWRAVHSPEAVAIQALQYYRNALVLKRPAAQKGARGSSRNAVAQVGSKGMVLLRYVGGNSGVMTFVGEITGQQYKFGGERSIGYVDMQDAPAMLRGRKLSRGRKTPVEFKRVEA